jgi:hypothetical protein
MTAVAVAVFLFTKFREGAWIVTIAIPLLMYLFAHTESYYANVASELKLGLTPRIPQRCESVVIVPTSTVNLLTEQALSAALSLGETVIAIAVAGDEAERTQIKQDWDQWRSGVPLEVLVDPQRRLIRTVLQYVDSIPAGGLRITVLIPEIVPSKRRHEILHNQRGRLLETALKSHTTRVVVATLPFHIHD